MKTLKSAILGKAQIQEGFDIFFESQISTRITTLKNTQQIGPWRREQQAGSDSYLNLFDSGDSFHKGIKDCCDRK